MGKPKISEEKCFSCGGCISVCPEDAITMYFRPIIGDVCSNCGICIKTCPIGAIGWNNKITRLEE
jgi:MinD superfamily P-loop ATPase